MKKANADIREKAKKAGVPFWAIAEKLGVSEATFTRRMRFELLNDDKRTIGEAISSLTGKGREFNEDADN